MFIDRTKHDIFTVHVLVSPVRVRMSVHFDSSRWTRHIFMSSTVLYSAMIFELNGLSSFHEYLAINPLIDAHA